MEERRLQLRQRNVDIEGMLYLDSSQNIVGYKITRLQALRNISVGKEFYVNYNAAYMFPQ